LSSFCSVYQACWVVNSFSEVKFKNVDNLKVAVDCIRTILSTDKELPVRVEAATSIQMLLSEQEKGIFILKKVIYYKLTWCRSEIVSVIESFCQNWGVMIQYLWICCVFQRYFVWYSVILLCVISYNVIRSFRVD